MADAWSYLPGTTGDAWDRMCGTSGDAWSRLPGNVGDTWDRLIETCGEEPPVTRRWKRMPFGPFRQFSIFGSVV